MHAVDVSWGLCDYPAAVARDSLSSDFTRVAFAKNMRGIGSGPDGGRWNARIGSLFESDVAEGLCTPTTHTTGLVEHGLEHNQMNNTQTALVRANLMGKREAHSKAAQAEDRKAALRAHGQEFVADVQPLLVKPARSAPPQQTIVTDANRKAVTGALMVAYKFFQLFKRNLVPLVEVPYFRFVLGVTRMTSAVGSICMWHLSKKCSPIIDMSFTGGDRSRHLL